jgi:hypothetical protein
MTIELWRETGSFGESRVCPAPPNHSSPTGKGLEGFLAVVSVKTHGIYDGVALNEEKVNVTIFVDLES